MPSISVTVTSGKTKSCNNNIKEKTGNTDEIITKENTNNVQGNKERRFYNSNYGGQRKTINVDMKNYFTPFRPSPRIKSAGRVRKQHTSSLKRPKSAISNSYSKNNGRFRSRKERTLAYIASK